MFSHCIYPADLSETAMLLAHVVPCTRGPSFERDGPTPLQVIYAQTYADSCFHIQETIHFGAAGTKLFLAVA